MRTEDVSAGDPGSCGAALVLGGGIAGIQSGLDLAEGGYKVYLVERQPALGGHMAQLDKTFPTNDCAMCTLAPRLVEAGRHRDIEIVTDAELVGLEGEPGRFTARVLRHARYVDPDRCTSCGACVPVCPVAVPDAYNEGLGERKATWWLPPPCSPKEMVARPLGAATPSSLGGTGSRRTARRRRPTASVRPPLDRGPERGSGARAGRT